MARRGQRAGRIGIERAARIGGVAPALTLSREHVPRGAHHVLPLTGAEHRVDLREIGEQRLAGALRQASGDDQSL